jgi:Ca-activated chloride channel homolog
LQLSDQESLDGSDRYKTAITDLGLKYALLTAYTSFIAVDHVVRNTAPQNNTDVNQPSPMPEGVSNQAIGAEVPGTPEPETWGAMLLTASLLAMLARRRQKALRAHQHYSA